MPPGLADLLLRSTDLPDIAVLEAHIRETASRVAAHFRALVGEGA
jgi:glutamate-ammonia-ligase adenylyltransferase